MMELIVIPIFLTCLILTQTCPPFSFIMKKGELVGLLTVYADDQDVEGRYWFIQIIAVRELRVLCLRV